MILLLPKHFLISFGTYTTIKRSKNVTLYHSHTKLFKGSLLICNHQYLLNMLNPLSTLHVIFQQGGTFWNKHHTIKFGLALIISLHKIFRGCGGIKKFAQFFSNWLSSSTRCCRSFTSSYYSSFFSDCLCSFRWQ